MRFLCAALFLLFSVTKASAQPANKVYWVGPETGGLLNSSNWASSSGGTAGTYPSNIDYQLIFDGGGTAGKTYTVNLNTAIGGYIVVANNTTVILQGIPSSGSMFSNSGYGVQAGSKLVLENNRGGVLFFQITSNAYNSSVAGELVVKGPVVTCTTQSSCIETWLVLSGLITPSGTKTLTISGTLRMDGTKSMIHTSVSNSLVFAANSNLVLNSSVIESIGVLDVNSTTTITGIGLGDPGPFPFFSIGNAVGNLIYDCPFQTNDFNFYNASPWTVKGSFTVKSTGTGNLTLSGGTIERDFILQGAAKSLVGNCTVNGNVDIQNGQPLDLNGTLTVKGNFTNAGVVKVSTTVLRTARLRLRARHSKHWCPALLTTMPFRLK